MLIGHSVVGLPTMKGLPAAPGTSGASPATAPPGDEQLPCLSLRPVLPPTNCTTLRKNFNFFVPPFPHL